LTHAVGYLSLPVPRKKQRDLRSPADEERANSGDGHAEASISMKVSSAQNTGLAGVDSSGSSSAQTGKPDASFASLLDVVDGDRGETPPVKDNAGKKQTGPGRKDMKDGDRESGNSGSLSQTGLITNSQLNPANLSSLLLAAQIAPALNTNAEIAGTSSPILTDGTGTPDSLDGAPFVPMPAAGSKTATGPSSKAVAGQITAAVGVAVEGDESRGLFGLHTMDGSGIPVESSSKPAITNSDKSAVDPGVDASDGTLKTGAPEVNIQLPAAAPSLEEPATGTALGSLQDVSQAGLVDAANSPKGSGAVKGVQAGTAAGVGMVSFGIEKPANSTPAQSVQAAATEKASGEQPAGTDPQAAGAPSVATAGGDQLASNSGQAHREGSGGAGDSSASSDSAQRSPDSKNVLTAADLTQVTRGEASAAPAVRAGVASASHADSSATQSGVQPMSEAGVARALQSAMRGDVRVGVQTEAFGRVTIQTIAGDGQLSAQLSLENVKQSAALAVHLPAVEQKLTQQYGLSASVSLAGGTGRDAGSMMGDGGRGSNPDNNYPQSGADSASARGGRFNPFLPAASSVPAIHSISSRYRGPSPSARLDVTV
jgi:hypothetical protein